MTNARPALLLLSASLLPVVVLAGVMGWFFISEQRQGIDTGFHDRASILASALERELDKQIQLLAVVADSPRLDLPVSRSSFTETARRLNDQIPGWQQLRVSNEDGDVVLSYPALSPSAPRKVVDLASHERLLRTGVPVIGDAVVGPQGKAAFAIRVPIRRNDRIKAVLSVVIRPDLVTRLLHESGLPKDWSAWIVDSQDRVVAATGSPEASGQPVAQFALPKGADLVELAGGGVPLKVAEAQVGDTPWRVRVGLPSSQYDRPAIHATMILVGASCLTIMLCGCIAVLLSRELRARTTERESLANWQRMDALGKLTGQAAHDFNNLLMVFQTGVDGIARRRNDEERITRYLGHMRDGVERGKGITRRLLSFARRSNQGAEHIELDTMLVDKAPLLKQALNDSIVIELKAPDDIWPVHVDPIGLEIALINILTNAREAMSDGGQVTITARNVSDAATEDKRIQGPAVALTVTDTGKGIAANDLERIFEPFFSTKTNGGPGLGLTQVLGFAEGSGGAVRAASLPGHGTAITMLLPKSAEERKPRESRAVEPGSPSHILIVDDTPSSLESARLTLEEFAITIHTAQTGSQAIELLQRHPEIDALVSDIMMPGMSGIELAEKVAKSNSSLRIVLMTGYSDKLEAGAQLPWPVVMKPFERKDIVKALTIAASSATASGNVVRLEIPAKS